MFGSRQQICQYYQRGNCKYGNKCWNIHSSEQGLGTPRNVFSGGGFSSTGGAFSKFAGTTASPLSDSKFSAFVKQIQNEMNLWEQNGMWQLSCLGPLKDHPLLTGFIDTSPEELRVDAYEARQLNNLPVYEEKYKEKMDFHKQLRLALKNQVPEAVAALKAVFYKSNSPNTTDTTNVFANQSKFGSLSTPSSSSFGVNQKPSIFGGGSVFGASKNQASVFGSSPAFGSADNKGFGAISSSSGFGSNQPSKSQFGGNTQSNQPASIFGSGSQSTQSNSLFGGSSQSQGLSIFGGNSLSQGVNAFGGSCQPQGTSVFGSNSQSQKSNVFGSQPQGTGLFGSQPQGSSVFGSQPQGGSLFSSQPQGTSLFGNSSQTQETSSFGGNSQSQTSSLFRNPNSQTSNTGNIFGAGSLSTSSSSIFGVAPKFGALGAQQQSGILGSQPQINQSSSIFGSIASTSQHSNILSQHSSTSTTGSVFGGPSQATPAPNTLTSNFAASNFGNGNLPNSTLGASSNVFKAPNSSQSSSMFGSNAFSSSSTAMGNTSMFGGNSTSMAFNQQISSSNIFQTPANTSTSIANTLSSNIFGSLPSAASGNASLFGSVSSSSPTVNTVSISSSSIYTPMHLLSLEDKEEFERDVFIRIPLVPPPRELCV